MAGAEAYCVEMGRNVTIFQARDYYFKQPAPRRKLTFLCGDSRCRALLRPAVIGENYHKLDNSPDKKKSPCFRENIHHLHIGSCNWISDGVPATTTPRAKTHNIRASQACAELGLIFRPYPGSRKKKAPIDEGEIESVGTPSNKPGTCGGSGSNGEPRKRPETNRFIPAVAMLHLNFTKEQKRTTPLAIEGYADGTFYSICNLIRAYHPAYYARRIYYGRCNVESLTNVMMVKFWAKLSLVGDQNARAVAAEISLAKARLKDENADLLSNLQALSDSQGDAWCYFFSDATPKVVEFTARTVARFSIASLDHVAVIPMVELTAPELAESEP